MADAWKFIGPTALSSTTAVQLGGASKDLPDGAKMILEVVPVLSSPAGDTANEPIVAEVYLESDDFPVVPYHILAQPIGSSLLKPISQVQGSLKDARYPINVKLSETGGGKLNAYGKGLFDHTIEPYVGCAVRIADYLKSPRYKAKIGTFTNTGTSAAEAAGSGITIDGGRRLKEVNGFVVGTTVAALKGLLGYFRVTCDGFTPAWQIEFPVNPASGVVDTDIHEAIAGVARFPVDIGLKPKVTINDFFNLSVALTTTGNFIMGVLYT